MRDIFIDLAERLLGVMVVLSMIAVMVGAAGFAMTEEDNGLWLGLAVLVLGLAWVVVIAGTTFVAFGIYRNTLETNRLLREADRGR